ncbi:MAG: mechanosensitive ion channel family protein, partial [Halomonas venusta]|nr:mechanosensitive ion channel family protein [Halomonas venusta]
SSVNIRVVIKTTPGDQWGVGRAYNRLVKLRFDAAGIEIPFPHTTLYFGETKGGKTPPANVRVLDSTAERKQVETSPIHQESEQPPDQSIQDTDESDHLKPDHGDVDSV